jgi:hypothetical protein
MFLSGAKLQRVLKKLNTPLWAFRAEYVKRKRTEPVRKDIAERYLFFLTKPFCYAILRLLHTGKRRIPSGG